MQSHFQRESLPLHASTSRLAARLRVGAAILLALSTVMHGQEPTRERTGHTWSSVKALPANTQVHISTDHGGKTCRIFSVTDDVLTCSKFGHKAGAEIQRTEITHIKLAHYLRSTLVGVLIGGGAGVIGGAVLGSKNKTSCGPNEFCLGGLGIGSGGLAGIFGASGAVLGGAIGGPTDMARGSSIYSRP